MPDPDDKAAATNPYQSHIAGGGQEAYAHKTNPCRASDVKAPEAPNLFFAAMNRCLWISNLVGEDTHGHHHSFGSLAHRPGIDLPFHVFVSPKRAR